MTADDEKGREYRASEQSITISIYKEKTRSSSRLFYIRSPLHDSVISEDIFTMLPRGKRNNFSSPNSYRLSKITVNELFDNLKRY